MRKIFSSQRVETAEGVAALLREAGIEVRLSNGRSYRTRRSGQFSYMERGNAQNYPTVWVVHANQQPQAREILRQARLLDTTRQDLPDAEYAFAGSAESKPANWAWRIRLALLAIIGLVAIVIVFHRFSMSHPSSPATPATQQAPADTPAPATDTAPAQPLAPDEERIRIQP